MTTRDDAELHLRAHLELQHRLANIESVLKQVLEILQDKRTQKHKRARSAAFNAYQSVVASGFQPTEEQLRAARLSHAKARAREITRELKKKR